MLNIVIPMAGLGSRFTKAGYSDPKPLIPIDERPMIQWVIENIRPAQAHRFLFIVQQHHLQHYPQLESTLQELAPNCIIIPIDYVTEGAACTVLLAKEHIDNDQPLMIANSDQYVDCDINPYLDSLQGNDGLIMTFKADDPKWSYAKVNDQGHITQVVEKEVVSDEATVGIYNFARGSDFVHAASTMIARDLRVNGEFYVAPAYDMLIEKGATIIPYNIGDGRSGGAMYGLGTPEDLDYFKTTELFKQLSGNTSDIA